MVKKLFFIATLLYIGATVSAENYLVKSPDGKIAAELNTNKSLFNLNTMAPFFYRSLQ